MEQLPYPTAMGRRNNRIIPAVATLEGKDFTIVEGKKRTTVPAMDGYAAQPVRWIVRADKPVKIDVKVTTRLAWGDAKTLDLGGAK